MSMVRVILRRMHIENRQTAMQGSSGRGAAAAGAGDVAEAWYTRPGT
jgi:hypothetical protein